MSIENRWKQRFQNFEKAYHKLQNAVQLKKLSELERAGLIQTFEFTFELAWKTLKDVLEYEGYEVKSPRETIKKAFETEYIADGEGWLDILNKCNLMAHTYNENTSIQVAKLITDSYFKLILELYKLLEIKISQ